MANEYNDKSPNTQGRLLRNFSNENAMFAIKMDFWKDSAKLSFCPRLNEKTEYGDYKYAFDTFGDDFKRAGISILIRASECKQFYDDYKKYIVPSIEGLIDPKVIGISKGDSLLTLDPNKCDDGVCRPKLVLYTKIDPSTMKCADDNVFTFQFNTATSIYDYNHKTGEYKTLVTHGELAVFMSDLECLVEGTSMGYVHAAATHDKWYKDMIKDRLNSIAEKNGIPVTNRRGFNGAGGKGDIFSNRGNSQEMVANDEVINSLDDLPFN